MRSSTQDVSGADYKPTMMIRQCRLLDPRRSSRRKQIQGIFNRSSFAIGAQGSPTFLINEITRRRAAGMISTYGGAPDAGLLLLCEAIDRAGPRASKIQAALKATDLKPDQFIMGYNGVKFDDKGQNVLAAGW